jgi:signal transduction histidine kinase
MKMTVETHPDDFKTASRSHRVRVHPPEHPSSLEVRIVALRTLTELKGLTDEEFTWLATHCNERVGPDGSTVFVENEPSHHLHFILEGEVNVHRRNSGPATLFIGRAGRFTGKLPFSRMKTWGADGYSYGPVWLLDLHEEFFPDLLAAIPSMAQRSVSMLLDRVREFTRADEQGAKLAALGKLAANLAHELNNPASAAQRAAANLSDTLGEEDDAKYALGFLCESQEELDAYRNWAAHARQCISARVPGSEVSDPLAASDREDELQRWLASRNIPDAWEIAPTLAESGLPVAMLDSLAGVVNAKLLPLAVTNFAGIVRSARATDSIVGSTNRIFEIIAAIKDYSYMDQAPIQDVDLGQSLDRTLAMLQSRLGQVTIERAYDPSLPCIRAYGSELSQVWTALIENALDAMQNRGTLKLSTRLKADFAFVEIWDDGTGIDPAIKGRIFEPFFTTKPLGTALGLGLDAVQRIVGKHFGTVNVESNDEFTCFQVRLPLDRTLVY